MRATVRGVVVEVLIRMRATVRGVSVGLLIRRSIEGMLTPRCTVRRGFICHGCQVLSATSVHNRAVLMPLERWMGKQGDPEAMPFGQKSQRGAHFRALLGGLSKAPRTVDSGNTWAAPIDLGMQAAVRQIIVAARPCGSSISLGQWGVAQPSWAVPNGSQRREMAAGKRKSILIKLVSAAGTGFFYTTRKNPRNLPHKLAFRKYDPVVRQHVLFQEAKINKPK